LLRENVMGVDQAVWALRITARDRSSGQGSTAFSRVVDQVNLCMVVSFVSLCMKVNGI